MRRLANKISLAMEERKRLRRRSPLSIAIADRFSQLSAEGWRAATDGGSVFHSAAYQRMFERVRPPNVEPRYALISDGDAPVAAVCLQIVTLDHSNLGDLKRRRMLRKLGAKMRTRVLVCGNLLVYGLHGVSIAAGADRAKVWQAVSEVIYRVRRAEKLAGSTDIVLLKDFDEAARQDSAVLRKLSYGAVETEPNMVLTVNPAWRRHEDYLQSLSSKFRSDIKNRVFKKFDEAGCSVELLEDVAAHAADLQQLYLQVHGNAGLTAVHRAGRATGRSWRSLLARTRACTWRAAKGASSGSSSACWMATRRSPITSASTGRRPARACRCTCDCCTRRWRGPSKPARGACRSAARRSSPRRGWDASPRRRSSGRAIGIRF